MNTFSLMQNDENNLYLNGEKETKWKLISPHVFIESASKCEWHKCLFSLDIHNEAKFIVNDISELNISDMIRAPYFIFMIEKNYI